jgi:hypothetical protein
VKHLDRTAWKEVAWNGISFLAPATWEPGTIGSRYLLLEEDARPVLEVKWGKIKGAFSHEAHLRRLAAIHGKGIGKTLTPTPLPSGWKEALASYEVKGFSWHGRKVNGKGVLIYCPACLNATLIQFYQGSSRQLKGPSQGLLRSFQDHRQDKMVVWSVFDVRAVIPDNYTLIRHRFEPGRSELVLTSGDQKLILNRWAPASVILCGQSLAQFAESVFHVSRDSLHPSHVAGHKAVEWSIAPSFTRPAHWWERLTARPSFRWLRLWHVEEKNRVMGIMVEGKSPFQDHFLEGICAGYESI